MARCFCRWRFLFICVCTSCSSLILMILFIGFVLCLTMQNHFAPQDISTETEVDNFFLAPGVHKNTNFAPFPERFWDSKGQDALWNQFQVPIDYRFNPILNTSTGSRNRSLWHSEEELIKQSFLRIRNSKSMRKNYDELPKQMQQFVQHMLRRDYPVLLRPPGICGAKGNYEKEPPLLLFAIKSKEMNIQNRIAIRKTWGREGWAVGWKPNSTEVVGGYIRRVFLLGKENTESFGMDSSDILKMENEFFGDILQWDFDDTFFNLTLKDILFWKWFAESCKQIAFVFKGDDDIFVNTPRMVTYLQEELTQLQAQKSVDGFMVGDVIGAANPSRANDSKYFIPETFYKGLYPSYAGGGGVIFSSQLIKRLHHISKRVHLFPIDDVYVGMCIVRLKANPIHHPAFLTFDFKEKPTLCSYHTIILVHKRSPENIIKLWKELKRTQTQCQHVDLREDKDERATTKAPVIDKAESDDTELFQYSLK